MVAVEEKGILMQLISGPQIYNLCTIEINTQNFRPLCSNVLHEVHLQKLLIQQFKK